MAKIYAVNENAFDKWVAAMAYFLGFLMADGYIRRWGPDKRPMALRINVCKKDKEVLEKLLDFVQSTHPIKNQDITNSCYVNLGNVYLCNRLVELGLTPDTTKRIFPNIPRSMLSHFIRGYFDGNGSAFILNDRGKPSLRMMISSGSFPFMDSIQNALSKYAGLKQKKIYKTIKGEAYYVRYAMKESVLLANYFYIGANDLCLERKRDLVLNYLSKKGDVRGCRSSLHKSLQVG